MLSVADRHLAQTLAAHDAVIIREQRADAYPAYAKGDRRKRPLRWVSDESFRCLTSFGGLRSDGLGFCIKESFAKRLAAQNHAGQHHDMEERELYLESGVKRPVRMNRAISAFDRICAGKDSGGNPLLSKAMQEAGRRFARDYEMSGHGHIATQNYKTAGADKTGYTGAAEDAHIRRIDAGNRFNEAKAAIGEGLDKAVMAVCCHDHRLEQIERAESWASGSGLTVLKMGLMRLVNHYGTTPGRSF